MATSCGAWIVRRVLLVFPAALLLASELLAQSPLDIHLSRDQEDAATVLPGDYRIRIFDKVPRFSYSVSIQRGFEEIAPIEKLDLGSLGADEDPCPGIKAAHKALNDADSEGGIPALVRSGRSALTGYTPPAGTTERQQCDAVATELRELLGATSEVFDTIYELKRGQYIEVTVTRVSDTGEERTWTRRFTTGAAGTWNVSYGYAFPMLSVGESRFGRTRNLRLDQMEDDSASYLIEETASHDRVDMMPSVFFSFLPVGVDGCWRFATPCHFNLLTGGLALDIENPAAFLGMSFTWATNLVLTGGLAVREEEIPQYEVGDTVPLIENDDLYKEGFRVRPFIALTYRFEDNPFSRSEEEEAAEPTPAGKKEEGGDGDGDAPPED